MEAIEAGRHRVVEPDAIFDRDGVQVWPQKGRTFYYDVTVNNGLSYGLFQVNEPPREERLIHTDPGSAWGYYQQPNGDVSFRRKDKR